MEARVIRSVAPVDFDALNYIRQFSEARRTNAGDR